MAKLFVWRRRERLHSSILTVAVQYHHPLEVLMDSRSCIRERLIVRCEVHHCAVGQVRFCDPDRFCWQVKRGFRPNP